jgi:hypothetical protein
MKNKRKYKFNSGIQQIAMDTPDYSKAYELQAEEGAKNQGIQNALGSFAGQYKGVADAAGIAGSAIKSRSKGKGGAQLGGAVATGGAAGAAGFNIGNKIAPGIGGLIGAGVGLTAGAFIGANRAGKEYTKGKRFQAEADRQAKWDNYNKGFDINGSATDAQANTAKKGKYKLKAQEQVRGIEFEVDELILGPKKADGTRDKIFMSKNGPTHEEGGIPGVVVPKKMYTSGTKQLMSQRKPYKNPEITPPTPYELLPKPPKSRYEKGGKYIKVYAEGSKGVSLAFSRGEKDPKGGLTQKGVDKYNRATGGNLKMAVTTPPSKLKAGSKAANRRKSFCARMSGVDGPMEKNGKPTRKALALRKWNC